MQAIRKFLMGSGGLLVVFSLGGLPFLLFGLYELARTAQMVIQYEQAEGVVLENIYQAFAEGGAAYVPRVEFQAADGSSRRFTDGIGSLPPDYEIGAKVTVLYDPQGAEQPRIRAWKRLWFAPLLFVGIGLIPVLAGLFGAYITRPRLPENTKPHRA